MQHYCRTCRARNGCEHVIYINYIGSPHSMGSHLYAVNGTSTSYWERSLIGGKPRWARKRIADSFVRCMLINGNVIAIGRVLLTTITPELPRLDCLPACLPICLPACRPICLSIYLRSLLVPDNGSIYLLAITAADRALSPIYQSQ
jgi:hypothetical protein